jgi:hypothetical protein
MLTTKRLVVIPVLAIMLMTGCSFNGVLKETRLIATTIASVAAVVMLLPPASDLATFNAADAVENLQFNNTKLANTSGDVTITISDENTGTLLGQQTFGYTINGNDQLTLDNPTAVTNWVRSFSSYNGYVEVKFQAMLNVYLPPQNQTATVSTQWLYQSTPYASSSTTFNSSPPGGGHLCTTCKQQ